MQYLVPMVPFRVVFMLQQQSKNMHSSALTNKTWEATVYTTHKLRREENEAWDDIFYV